MSVILLQNSLGRLPQTRMAEPVNFSLEAGEHIAVMGPNGGGKSCLVDLITGRNLLMQGRLDYDFGPGTRPTAYGNIVQLTFEDALGTVEKPYYYQQRFNSQDRDESPLVMTVLKRALASGRVTATGLSADEAREAGHGLTREEAVAAGGEDDSEFLQNPLLDTFLMRDLLPKRMVLLSSGEMRRYQLFKYLIKRPRVLIVDNPFIGLDAPMRDQLSQFFQLLVDTGEVQIIMLLSMLDTVPTFMTHVVEVDNMRVGEKLTREEYLATLPDFKAAPASSLSPELKAQIAALPVMPVANLTVDGSPTDEIISIRDLTLPLPDTDRVLSNLPCSVSSVPTILPPMPATSRSSVVVAARANPFGRSRSTSVSSVPSSIAPTRRTVLPSTLWQVACTIRWVSTSVRAPTRSRPASSGCVSSASSSCATACSSPFRVANSVCASWLVPSSRILRCSSSTNLCMASTPTAATSCATSSTPSAAVPTRHSSWSRTTKRNSPPTSRIGWCCESYRS